MKLLLDVGNTRVKWALGTPPQTAASGTVTHRDAAQWQLPDAWTQQPTEAFAVSVAGAAVNERLRTQLTDSAGITLRYIHPSAQAAGVRNTYLHPERLGADRWAAVVAAYHRGRGPACVIDCGSAATVDSVTAEGEYVGGVIMPGLAMMRRALNRDTAQLPRAGDGDVTLFARDTDAAIRSGTALGLVAMIEGIVVRLRETLGRELRVYLIGGDADALYGHLRVETTRAPQLVLEGVAILAEEAT